jgi:hypothetical protein
VRGGRHALGGGERQRGQGGAQELHGGDRDRVTAAQQPDLRHGERGRQQQRDEHQAVTGRRGAAPLTARDQADASERHGEPGPGHRPGHGALP